MIILRGTHELAVASGLGDVDRNTRTSLTFYEQFGDPASGLAMAREGLEIAGRRGSMSYAFMMVGNAASCAIRTGEWAWASALLAEWLEREITGGFYLELYVDRAVLTARAAGTWRPTWPKPVVSGDVQRGPGTLVRPFGSGMGCLHGRRPKRRARRRRSPPTASYSFDQHAAGGPAALWAGDAPAASRHRPPESVVEARRSTDGRPCGQGRGAEDAGPRRSPVRALRGWRQLACVRRAWRAEAILLAPTEREMAEAPAAIEAAGETLTRLGARPFLARLEAARASTAEPTRDLPAARVGSTV
jgi:hypothetical protein